MRTLLSSCALVRLTCRRLALLSDEDMKACGLTVGAKNKIRKALAGFTAIAASANVSTTTTTATKTTTAATEPEVSAEEAHARLRRQLEAGELDRKEMRSALTLAARVMAGDSSSESGTRALERAERLLNAHDKRVKALKEKLEARPFLEADVQKLCADWKVAPVDDGDGGAMALSPTDPTILEAEVRPARARARPDHAAHVRALVRVPPCTQATLERFKTAKAALEAQLVVVPIRPAALREAIDRAASFGLPASEAEGRLERAQEVAMRLSQMLDERDDEGITVDELQFAIREVASMFGTTEDTARAEQRVRELEELDGLSVLTDEEPPDEEPDELDADAREHVVAQLQQLETTLAKAKQAGAKKSIISRLTQRIPKWKAVAPSKLVVPSLDGNLMRATSMRNGSGRSGRGETDAQSFYFIRAELLRQSTFEQLPSLQELIALSSETSYATSPSHIRSRSPPEASATRLRRVSSVSSSPIGRCSWIEKLWIRASDAYAGLLVSEFMAISHR